MSHDARVARLRPVDLFASLAPEDLAAVAAIATEVEVPTGRTIARQGEIGSGMFVVERGRLRVARDGATIAELGPGDFFGELSVLDGGPRVASVIALEPSTCLAIATWDAERLLRERPGIALAFLRTLAGRLRARTEDHRH